MTNTFGKRRYLLFFWYHLVLILLNVKAARLLNATTTPIVTQEPSLEGPIITCDRVPADYCRNNGTCRVPLDDELWECSGDAGFGPLKCDCTPMFTGHRCETKIFCSDLMCLSTEVCDYNWKKQKFECILKNTSGQPPICKTGIQDVQFQFDPKNLEKRIICFDMYDFNTDSFCSDSDDSLTYLISQGPAKLPNLFCLVVDYQNYKTCLRVNATHRNSITMTQTQIEIQAEEYSSLERRASLQLQIIFNKPPIVKNKLLNWVVNTAELMLLDVLKEAEVTSSTDLSLTHFDLTNKDVVSASFQNKDLMLSLISTPSFDLKRFQAKIQISDSGIPQLSTIVTVQITLVRLVCQNLGTLKINIGILVPGASFSIGRLDCTVTPGYQLNYDIPSNAMPGLTISIDEKNKIILNVANSLPSLTKTVKSNSIVSIVQFPSIRQIVNIVFEFYYYSIIWFQQDTGLPNVSPTPVGRSEDLIDQVNNLINGEIKNIDVVSEVIQIRRGSWFDVIIKSNDSQALLSAILDVEKVINTGLLGSIKIKSASFQSINRTSHIFPPVMTLDRLVTNIFEDDIITVICQADFINTGEIVTVDWTMNGILIRPLPTSRFQITKSLLSAWTVESRLIIDKIMFIDAGRLGCQVRDESGFEVTGNISLGVISPPEVSVALTVFVQKGAVLSLSCSIVSDGGAISSIKWLVNGIEVGTGNVLGVMTDRDTDYTCIGSNIAGHGQPKITKVIIIPGVVACSSTTDFRNTTWLKAAPGSTSEQICPPGFTGTIFRDCDDDGVWSDPNYSSCIQNSLVDIQNQIIRLENGILVALPMELIRNLSSITKQSVLDKAEINLITKALKDCTDIMEINNVNISTSTQQENIKQYARQVVDLIESLFEPKQNLINMEMENTSISLLLLSAIDDVNQILGETTPEGQTTTITSEKIVLSVGNPNPFNINDISFPLNSTNETHPLSVLLPSDMFKKNTDYERVIWSVTTYNNLTSLPLTTSSNLTESFTKSSIPFQVNSDVISINIFAVGFDSTNLASDVTFTIPHLNSSHNSPNCSFWDVDFSRWDNTGCRLISTNQTSSTCSCNHLTNFALLMKPTSFTHQDEETLSTITLIGCTISIFCLLITILTYAFVWRYVRSNRAVLLLNLCVALIIALVLFLFGVDETGNKAVCTSIAVCLHYFYLVVFFLMLAEGVEVLVTIVNIFSSRSKLRELIIMGWGTPLIIVSISVGVTELEGYGNDKFCWLSVNSGLIWAFIGPALLVILVNFVIVIKIIYALLNTRVMLNKDVRIKAKAALRSICVLLPVLGVAWGFGVLTVNEDLIVFDYMFTILNTLQGLFIFIFHCVINRKVREGLANRRRRYRSRHTDLSAPQGSASKVGYEQNRLRNSRKVNHGDVSIEDDEGTVLKQGLDNGGYSNQQRGYFGNHIMNDLPSKRPIERLRYPSHDYQQGNYFNHFPEVSDGYSNLSVSENSGPIFANQNIAQAELNQELFRPALMRGNSILSGGISDRSGSLNSDDLSVFTRLPRPKILF